LLAVSESGAAHTDIDIYLLWDTTEKEFRITTIKTILEHLRRMHWIDFFNLLALVVLGIGEIWLAVSMLNIQSATLNLEIAGRRADVSILVDPAHNQNWTFVVPGGAYLTVNGTLCNEGTRTAIITQLELSMIYQLSEGKYILTRTYVDPSRDCNWGNSTIVEDERRPFSLTMYVDSYTVLDSKTGQTLTIGNSRSDELGVSVIYNDGISDMKSEQIFSAKS